MAAYVTPKWSQSTHNTARFKLGRRIRQDDKEFIYAKGVASTLAGSWVILCDDETDGSFGTTQLAVADKYGRVAVAMAATDASTGAKFGWYAIYGIFPALCLVSFDGTNGAGVWLTSTPGSVDDTEVVGDAVIGAVGRSDRNTTTGMSYFELSYPECLNHVV